MDKQMLIGSRFEAGTESEEHILNPKTGETVIDLPEASHAQIDAAVDAAEKAFVSWSMTTPGERSAYLLRIADAIERDADGFQTFRYVILPNIGTALLAGGMLAFALSFDEVIVTTFTAGQQQTLPIWMLEELVRPRQRPVTNVVAMVVVLVTFLPILAAYYLTREGDQVAGAGK